MPPPLEIERVFLLRGVPAIPRGAEIWRIEQGYLPRKLEQQEFGGVEDDAGGAGEIAEGRIRRVFHPDGSVRYLHTIKRGLGLVREEIEQRISREQFERLWPRTAGAQLRKTRSRVREGELVWEIDEFHGFDLALAEVELPSADTPVELPEWLRGFVAREVTEEPEYRNSAIARRAGLDVSLRRDEGLWPADWPGQ
jgi:adenylate cyclase